MAENEAIEPERAYNISQLRDNCKALFNIEKEIFDGAFYGCTEKELTKQKAQNKINNWLRKEVQ